MFPITPYLATMAISLVLYIYLDRDKRVTNTIVSTIKVREEYKSVVFVLGMFAISILICIVVNLLSIAPVFLSIANGVVTGIGGYLASTQMRRKAR